MPQTLAFPDAAWLMEVEQSKLPALMLGDPIFEMFPITNKDAAHVIWEQMDDYRGLMNARGVNDPATGITMVGSFAFQMDPGRYGEYVLLTEKEIENRRPLGSYEGTLDISQLVFRAQDRLLDRRLTRIKWILWTLLATGIFSVPGPNGGIIHKDQFAFQTASASVAWATTATAVPLQDLRAAKLKARGKSVRFDATSRMFMNQQTMNNLLNNTNPSDLFAKRLENGSTINSKADLDAVILANDLPQAVVWDDGYFTDANVFTLYIPNNTVIIIGSRMSGAAVGEFQMTRNVMNDSMAPGPYTIVSDSANATGQAVIPRVVRVDDGFNGGPAVFFPGAVIILSC